MSFRSPLRLTLVSDDSAIHDAVSRAFRQPHAITPLSFDDIEGATGVSERAADATRGADAVLVEWDSLQAPTIGLLARLLHGAPAPLVALGPVGETDHVAALAIGVDRYLPLPPSPYLLRAQIIAHQRHHAPTRPGLSPVRPVWVTRARIEIGGLVVDWPERRARVFGAVLDLTPRQFEILFFFAVHAGELVSRDMILESIWGLQFDPGTNVIDVYVHHLRRVMAATGAALVVETVRGRGYRLAVGTDRSADS